jgi:pyruvate/2-oxoglutarate dehydrogenase complex dihydrolipoamide dehydrogenase (E3) component
VRGRRFLVIGGGPAGAAAAEVAAEGGAGVTLVEADTVGGASQLRDCIPSKALAASAQGLAAIRASGHLGLGDPGPLHPGEGRLAERRQTVAALASAAVVGRLESLGVTLLAGRARFDGPNTAVVTSGEGEKRLAFDEALIATGSLPRIPPWAEADGESVLTSRQAYRLGAPPGHAVVVGAGATGVEFAHVFSALGSRVTLLASRGRVLPHADPQASAALEEEFSARGITLLRGARAAVVRPGSVGVEVVAEDGRVSAGSHCLLAVGLVPCLEGLGLDAAGVATDGGVVVVDGRQRTSVPHIYAAGDVVGEPMLSSLAAAQGREVGRQVLGLAPEPVDGALAVQAVFTEPEIAWVGLQEPAGRKVRVSRATLAANTRAQILARPRGFIKVLSDPDEDVILGGLVVGSQAAELAGILALAVHARLRRSDLAGTVMAFPSLAESLAAAVR